MKRRVIIYVLMSIFAIVFVVSAIQIYRIQSEYKKGVDEYRYLYDQAIVIESGDPSGSIKESAAEKLLGFSINFNEMYSTNSDYVGWIFIPDTEINYPMVVSYDNDYYLHRTFLKEYNFAGTLFLDCLTYNLDFFNTIIYGHRMNNGSMFADLEKYLLEPYYSEHKTIYIFSKNELLVYEVFTCRKVELDDECYAIGFADSDDFYRWVLRMKGDSNYSTSLAPTDNSNVITLSTCVRNDDTMRIILQAQLVDRYPLT